MTKSTTEKFPPFIVGNIYISQGVDTATKDNNPRKQEILLALSKHARKDWGLAKKEKGVENDKAIEAGRGCVISRHKLTFGKIMIVTDLEQKKTTILLCNTY